MKPAEIKSKHRVVAYLRISTGDQDINAQRLELHWGTRHIRAISHVSI